VRGDEGAADVGITGYEDRDALMPTPRLGEQIEAIRPAVGERMNLGDVRDKSVPKMMLLVAPASAMAVR
jgi:4-oxalomesaconate tautomerase